MTFRKIVIGFAAILLIAMLVPVAFADNQTPQVPVNTASKLSEDQIKQVEPALNKMLEAKKELFSKYVDMGLITKEDADARLQRMEQNQKNRLQNGFLPGMGKGRGGCGGGGCGGGGCNFSTQAPGTTPTGFNQL